MVPEVCIAISIVTFAATFAGFCFGLKLKSKEVESLREQRDTAHLIIDKRDDELTYARGENERRKIELRNEIEGNREKSARIETLEKENEHLRGLILDVKNIVTEG